MGRAYARAGGRPSHGQIFIWVRGVRLTPPSLIQFQLRQRTAFRFRPTLRRRRAGFGMGIRLVEIAGAHSLSSALLR